MKTIDEIEAANLFVIKRSDKDCCWRPNEGYREYHELFWYDREDKLFKEIPNSIFFHNDKNEVTRVFDFAGERVYYIKYRAADRGLKCDLYIIRKIYSDYEDGFDAAEQCFHFSNGVYFKK